MMAEHLGELYASYVYLVREKREIRLRERGIDTNYRGI